MHSLGTIVAKKALKIQTNGEAAALGKIPGEIHNYRRDVNHNDPSVRLLLFAGFVSLIQTNLTSLSLFSMLLHLIALLPSTSGKTPPLYFSLSLSLTLL